MFILAYEDLAKWEVILITSQSEMCQSILNRAQVGISTLEFALSSLTIQWRLIRLLLVWMLCWATLENTNEYLLCRIILNCPTITGSMMSINQGHTVLSWFRVYSRKYLSKNISSAGVPCTAAAPGSSPSLGSFAAWYSPSLPHVSYHLLSCTINKTI